MSSTQTISKLVFLIIKSETYVMLVMKEVYKVFRHSIDELPPLLFWEIIFLQQGSGAGIQDGNYFVKLLRHIDNA